MIIKTENARQKAKKIKMFIFDVDGVMTDGGIIYTDKGEEIKKFNVLDGMIIFYLKKELGFKVGVITGRKSEVVEKRCQELQLDFHYHGAYRKISFYEQIRADYDLLNEQIAYIGDDVNDLPILSVCGLSCCPSSARDYIKERVDVITKAPGGHGAIRDFAEFVLAAQGKLDDFIDFYLKQS